MCLPSLLLARVAATCIRHARPSSWWSPKAAYRFIHYRGGQNGFAVVRLRPPANKFQRPQSSSPSLQGGQGQGWGAAARLETCHPSKWETQHRRAKKAPVRARGSPCFAPSRCDRRAARPLPRPDPFTRRGDCFWPLQINSLIGQSITLATTRPEDVVSPCVLTFTTG
jgi:hypothetical protein